MSERARWALWAFVIASILLFLAVSYDNTRQMAAQFHMGWNVAPWLLAAAAEIGVIGCSAARVVRERAGLDARGFTWTLAGVLAVSFVANLLAGAEAFVPDLHVLDYIRARPLLRWPLIGMFAALVPVLIFAFSELFATLVMEGEQGTRKRASIPPSPNLQARIIEIYEQRPLLPPAEVARLAGCSASTARRVRAKVIKGQSVVKS